MRERELLEHIFTFNRGLPDRVSIPPGDDMGAVRIGDAEVLITVDQVAEGVHFRLADTPLELIGRKAITRNLSDVAAMAAKPVGAVVAGCLPRDFGAERANALFDAMRRAAERYGCPLIGGDISMWDQPLVLSVTVLAEPAGVAPVLRRGARVGDVVCVTGSLGGSLETVQTGAAGDTGAGGDTGAAGSHAHHLAFTPRIAEARLLAQTCRPNCMIDLSDGLGRDLGHLCRAADAPVGAKLIADQLPISPGGRQAAQRTGKPAWQHAVGDGEDYELCFTVSPAAADRDLPADLAGVPVTRIGRIVERGEDEPLLTIALPDGVEEVIEDQGWEHG